MNSKKFCEDRMNSKLLMLIILLFGKQFVVDIQTEAPIVIFVDSYERKSFSKSFILTSL